MNKIIRNILFFFLTVLTSCSYFTDSITRTSLYKDVIHHYKNEDCNKEKENAALYLFKYMDNKYSCFDSKAEDAISVLIDSIKQSKGVIEKKKKIKILTENAPKSQEVKFVKDLSVIKSSDLIKHIDITYDAWKKISKVSGASYQDYCDYILPYRVSNEKYGACNTESFNKEYSHIRDSLINKYSVTHAMWRIVNYLDCRTALSLSKIYSKLYSPEQIDHIKLTPRCDDKIIYMILVFRSLGIPAAYDYIPQWGDHPSSGHSWLSVKWQGKWYALEESWLNGNNYSESIPKIYRRKYSSLKNNNSVDVTNTYLETVDLKMKMDTVSDFKSYSPAIAIFNKFKGYNIVDNGIIEGSDFVFKNLGRDVCYFIGGIRDKRFTPLTNPVFIDSCGIIKYLNPNFKKLDTLCLYRKYPLSTKRYRIKLLWAKSLSGSWFEGSNDNFKTKDVLLKLDDYNSYKEESFKLKSIKPYKSIQICFTSSTNVASLKFFDKNHKILKGSIFHHSGKCINLKRIFDDDILSWGGLIVHGSSVVSVGYNFDNPHYISEIAILSRNDGNQIIVGDNYQLMFYNNGWKNLGIKTALKQELIFENVPSGGLYWIKNLTEGVEELPFIFDNEGNQYWPGQY